MSVWSWAFEAYVCGVLAGRWSEHRSWGWVALFVVLGILCISAADSAARRVR